MYKTYFKTISIFFYKIKKNLSFIEFLFTLNMKVFKYEFRPSTKWCSKFRYLVTVRNITPVQKINTFP